MVEENNGKKPAAIVVVAYNRPASLERLLHSIAGAFYPKNQRIPLVISIDHSDTDVVKKVAEDFEWKYGEKRIIAHRENLGLKKHVLSCGDLTKEYESIIMLEDDLYVSRVFYRFAIEALEAVKGEKRVAGVSLYNHLLNVHAREPFEALADGYDNWYFQFASSWGQAWNKEQWEGFRQWFSENEGRSLASDRMPENVSSWSAKSWLKYFISYMIEKDLYFLYPRISLTTNFAEEGTHAVTANNDLQVPLLRNSRRTFYFSSLTESEAVYDAFFENVILRKYVASLTGGIPSEIQIDLYGYHPFSDGKKYLLTSQSLPYRVIKSYGRKLRPMDANILDEIAGEDFFLYDTKQEDTRPFVNETGKLLYHYRALKSKEALSVITYRIRQKLSKKK